MSGQKAHTNTQKLNWNVSTITDVLLDQKRVNVCEHMVKTVPSLSCVHIYLFSFDQKRHVIVKMFQLSIYVFMWSFCLDISSFFWWQFPLSSLILWLILILNEKWLEHNVVYSRVLVVASRSAVSCWLVGAPCTWNNNTSHLRRDAPPWWMPPDSNRGLSVLTAAASSGVHCRAPQTPANPFSTWRREVQHKHGNKSGKNYVTRKETEQHLPGYYS